MSPAPPLAIALESIASCFEGMIPASICTCSEDGTPNITNLSVVHRIDGHHVALSYQFFNKTRANILQNAFAQVVVVSTSNLRQYRLDLRYDRTETEGAIFDRVATRLDAVASQTGMSQVFKLRGVDIYRVLDCRPMTAETGGEGGARVDFLPQIEEFTTRLAACGDLEAVINESLESMSALFGYDHSFLMAPDEEGKRLFTLGSRGFGESGIGSEVWMGEGILGVAAERREVVRARTSIETWCTRLRHDRRWSVRAKTACWNGRSLCRACRKFEARSSSLWSRRKGCSGYSVFKVRVQGDFCPTMSAWCESRRARSLLRWRCWSGWRMSSRKRFPHPAGGESAGRFDDQALSSGRQHFYRRRLSDQRHCWPYLLEARPELRPKWAGGLYEQGNPSRYQLAVA